MKTMTEVMTEIESALDELTYLQLITVSAFVRRLAQRNTMNEQESAE